jgi:hypothetical protein
MGVISVDPQALKEPAARFRLLRDDLHAVAGSVEAAASNGGSAAGNADVAAGAAEFGTGLQAVMRAVADESGLLGDKVEAAAVRYENDDQAYAVRFRIDDDVPRPGHPY